MGYSKISIEVLNIETLKRKGDITSLVKALDHRSRLVRESAADALSEIGSELIRQIPGFRRQPRRCAITASRRRGIEAWGSFFYGSESMNREVRHG